MARAQDSVSRSPTRSNQVHWLGAGPWPASARRFLVRANGDKGGYSAWLRRIDGQLVRFTSQSVQPAYATIKYQQASGNRGRMSH